MAFLLLVSLNAQNLLQSGPMPAYSTMMESAIFVQTTQAAEVYIEYHDINGNDTKSKSSIYQTTAPESFCATIIAAPLEPGHTYTYDVYINGKKEEIDQPLRFVSQPLFQWRTDPPNIKFATGSCAFINEVEYDRPGKSYGGGYKIFESIRAKQPEFMLWLGDNVYLREVDWFSETGIRHRYFHDRGLDSLQP